MPACHLSFLSAVNWYVEAYNISTILYSTTVPRLPVYMGEVLEKDLGAGC
jgi:hypothetical protein